jgi:two-component system sensor histidine kinase PilS (NtrC family)
VAHLGVSVSAVGPEPGTPAGVLCLFSDLTEIRALEEKVRLRESLAEVGQLSAGIAHEVRNSFGTVLGYSKLLLRVTDGEAREHADAIRREVESARGILDDYLRFARPVSLNLERVRLGDLVAEVVAGLRDDPVAEDRDLVIDGQWVELEADVGLLRQALVNLLRNGLEAAGPRGRVGVRGSLQGDPAEFVLEVHDSGPGLAADVSSADLFRPFFTTKAAGIGLGLAWVRKTVVYHDGRVDVGRGPWGGASFRIVLPLRRGGGDSLPLTPSA